MVNSKRWPHLLKDLKQWLFFQTDETILVSFRSDPDYKPGSACSHSPVPPLLASAELIARHEAGLSESLNSRETEILVLSE